MSEPEVRRPFEIQHGYIEPDGKETIHPATTNMRIFTRHDPSNAMTQEDVQTLLRSIVDHTKAINALVEQNQMLIQAMAEGEGVEEVDRYQTL
ncbi:MAG: hypothetical protein V4628_11555 [Pseudomonadota bacterium]